jgi:NADH-quinone oxidoreductase subunit L
MALLTVFLTAFYIFRAIFLAFTGEPRTEAARNATESPGIMTGPMLILALLSVVSGWVGIPEGFGLPIGTTSRVCHPSEFAAQTLNSKSTPSASCSAGLVRGRLLASGGYALYVRAGALGASPQVLAPTRSWIRAGTSTRSTGDVRRGRGFWAARAGSTAGPRAAHRRVGRGAMRFGRPVAAAPDGGVQNYALFILLAYS